MKTFGNIILLAIIFSIGSVAYLSWSETESNSFKSYQSVVESGLVNKGWVPSFIPKSSYDINEHHRVDTPYIFVELKFKKEDLRSIEEACNKLEENVYTCRNSGFPVKVTISNQNHAVIESI